MHREPILEFACLIIGILMIFGFFYASATVDLGASSYDELTQFLIEVPSVMPLVTEALSDEVLTLNEFNDIEEYVEDEAKRVVLSKVAGAD
ncbi:hypothetical protein [Vibrio rotiferianus]|uniref:hypothetical protein n=1 Tax=Vibrio rotiferianus TaxID=190895 RepID=UPI0038B354AF